MTAITIKSEEAITRLYEVLDHCCKSLTEAVIEHDNKPLAVVVSYREWQKLKALQKQQRHEAIAQARREMDAGHYFTEEQVESGLRQRDSFD